MRALATFVLLLSLVAPVLAGSQPSAKLFETLSGTLHTLAGNAPRAKNASLTDVVHVSPSLTITQMQGSGNEPTYVSFRERIGSTYTQTDIAADGKTWRRCNVLPRLYPAPELGMEVWVLGWGTNSGQWPVFQTIDPSHLERWTKLVARAITLRQNGGGFATDNGLLVVSKGHRKDGVTVWRKHHAGAPQRVVVAPSSGVAAAVVQDYATRVGGPAMAVGFNKL